MAGKKPHAIMIALPYQGHITPFVNLAMKLASKGFVITFVHLEFIHQTMYKAHHSSTTHDQVDIFSKARNQLGLDIRYTTISDGFPLEFDRDLHSDEYWDSMLRDFPARVDEFVGNIIRNSEPFLDHFLVADTYYTWSATVANKHNILNVSFWTQPALIFSISYHLDLLKQNNHFPCKDNIEQNVHYLPGVKSISTKDLMPYLKEAETESIVHRVVCMAFEEVKKADFVLNNTVQELECHTILALNKNQPNYAVGPINFSKNVFSTTVTKSLRHESDCTHWLDSKLPGSVLYVSFGSIVHTNENVIEEIAHGLLLSEVKFIWVVRDDIINSTDRDVLPVGFRDEVKDRGMIVPWCDQIMVLSNPAIGGFLTHCGWNSTFESMWFGVPMICYPITYDQPTNKKLVVEDWKIGISLCDGTSIHREEVAGKIRILMNGNTVSQALRREAKKVKSILHSALEIEGSSERNFDQFVKDLKAKIVDVRK